MALLLLALVIAFGFECINGFHDTANAVATVIYTKSMKPTAAVVWSGCWKFIGVRAGGISVASGLVHVLAVDLLGNILSRCPPLIVVQKPAQPRRIDDVVQPHGLVAFRRLLHPWW